MTTRFPFMFDADGVLTNQKCFILTSARGISFLKFLTGVFNSKLAKLWMWYNLPELNGGAREVSKVYFENMPIAEEPSIPAGTNAANRTVRIATLVDRILEAKKADPAADTTKLEADIDALVYKLYGLTDEEIAVVEGKDKATQKTLSADAQAPVVPPRKRGRIAAVEEHAADDDEVLE